MRAIVSDGDEPASRLAAAALLPLNDPDERCRPPFEVELVGISLENVCSSSSRFSRIFVECRDESVDDGVAGVTWMTVCGTNRSDS